MRDILIVVDMQKDFITGSLGTKEACAILPDVIEKIRNFDGEVIFTKDTHFENYMETQEGKNLPVMHCIKGTEGHEICEEIKAIINPEEYTIYEKLTKQIFQFLKVLLLKCLI